MAAMGVLQRCLARRIVPSVNRRFVSTSKKSNDTAVFEATKTEKKEVKNWISYGFEVKDKSVDRLAMHTIFFTTVTLCLVCGGYYIMHLPDYNLRDWSQREAFLELKRREENGLPLIDPNLVDPTAIALPSDEELGDMQIII